jgi:hypothetical protein
LYSCFLLHVLWLLLVLTAGWSAIYLLFSFFTLPKKTALYKFLVPCH